MQMCHKHAWLQGTLSCNCYNTDITYPSDIAGSLEVTHFTKILLNSSGTVPIFTFLNRYGCFWHATGLDSGALLAAAKKAQSWTAHLRNSLNLSQDPLVAAHIERLH
jgi:hypothetical protein